MEYATLALLCLLSAGIILPAIWALPDILRLLGSSLASLGTALLYTLLAAMALLSIGALLLLADRITAWWNPPTKHMPISPSRPRPSASTAAADQNIPDADDDDAWLENRKHRSLAPGEKAEGLTEKLWRKTKEHQAKPKPPRPKWRDDGEGVELKEMGSSTGRGVQPTARRRMPPPPPARDE